MALANNSISRSYHRLFVELADQRTNDWFLIKSPVPGLTIIGLYLYFTLKWGPRYMADKKPFQLQNTLVVYNFIQVIVSCWLFYEGLDAGWLRHYSWKCQPVDFSESPEAMRVARGVYVYFLAKISELLDTVFFVIRKKERQITFLHLYHHTVMPMISWGATKYYPGGHGTLIGVINSFVHIIMYTYYMLAAMGPKYQKYLFWKKHITTLQMLQFCIAFLHSSQLLFYDCGYPRWSVVFTLPNSIFFYYLFYDFYYKAYGKPGDKKDDEDKKNGDLKNGEIKNGAYKNGELRNGDYRNGEMKNGDYRNGEMKNCDYRNGEMKNGEMKNGDTKNGELRHRNVLTPNGHHNIQLNGHSKNEKGNGSTNPNYGAT